MVDDGHDSIDYLLLALASLMPEDAWISCTPHAETFDPAYFDLGLKMMDEMIVWKLSIDLWPLAESTGAKILDRGKAMTINGDSWYQVDAQLIEFIRHAYLDEKIRW